MSSQASPPAEPSEQNSIQLYGTDALCFDKNDFMKKDFNVDTFVHIHQASGSGGLEVLRDDLGVYLKILRSAMIDLINRDYADFVNLSTNLTGLDRSIEALKTPLGQLREEVMSVEQLLSEAISSVSNDLKRRHSINQQKAMLHRINQISVRLDRLEALLNSRGVGTQPSIENGLQQDSSPSGNDLVDRLATEVNHLNFLVAQCEGAYLVKSFKPRVETVCSFVEVGLERGLREGIQGANKQLLLRTLRTYASLGTIRHAHQQVRTILRTHLEEVISDSALRSDPRGLYGMFEKSLNTVRKVCDPLLSVSLGTGSDVVPGYSFLERAAWPEIVFALEARTPHIFNPGNPSLFHERYKQSMDFLTSFEKLLQYSERIEAFRKEPDLQKFLDQWNLPVYFQIRYQEIGQVMESSLSDSSHGLSPATSGSDFKLSSTHMVWESLLKCFNPEVFLLPLLHRFWKLLLLILSRHRTFIVHTTKSMKESIKLPEKTSSSSSSRGPQQQQQQPSSSQSSDTTKDDKARVREKVDEELRLTVFLLRDIDTLCSRIDKFYSRAVEGHVRHLPQEKTKIIIVTLEEQSAKHSALKAGLMEVITNHLIMSMNSPLKQVTDTPRIYRRTNKPLPSSHQAYVANAFAPLTAFVESSKGDLEEKEIKSVVEKVFSTVASHYHSLTFEVLSSVHKMEESLRRLKRARERGSQPGSNPSGTASDDDKIRGQIHLDVLYFGSQVSGYGIDSSNIESYAQLLQMVENAKEGKFCP